VYPIIHVNRGVDANMNRCFCAWLIAE